MIKNPVAGGGGGAGGGGAAAGAGGSDPTTDPSKYLGLQIQRYIDGQRKKMHDSIS